MYFGTKETIFVITKRKEKEKVFSPTKHCLTFYFCFYFYHLSSIIIFLFLRRKKVRGNCNVILRERERAPLLLYSPLFPKSKKIPLPALEALNAHCPTLSLQLLLYFTWKIHICTVPVPFFGFVFSFNGGVSSKFGGWRALASF